MTYTFKRLEIMTKRCITAASEYLWLFFGASVTALLIGLFGESEFSLASIISTSIGGFFVAYACREVYKRIIK